MLGASWVDKHSIAGPAAQHNRPLHALPLAAAGSMMQLLCGKQQLRPCASGPRAAVDPAVVAAGLGMQHLAPIEEVFEPLIPMAATRAWALVPHGCRRRGGGGGRGRNGTSAPWPACSAAARRRHGRCPGGCHRKTSRDGCGRSRRAGARQPAGPTARGQGWVLQARACRILSSVRYWTQSGAVQQRGGVGVGVPKDSAGQGGTVLPLPLRMAW
jgi:hypothetical protein